MEQKIKKEQILEALEALKKSTIDNHLVCMLIGLLPKIIEDQSMFSLEKTFKIKFAIEEAIAKCEDSLQKLKEAKTFFDGLVKI